MYACHGGVVGISDCPFGPHGTGQLTSFVEEV